MDKIALIVGYEKLEKENKRLQRDHDALLADVGRVSLIRQELERELIGVKAVVETFIRCVHADGDSDMDWGKLPTLLDAIEDYVDEGREALAIVAKLPRCNRLNDDKTALEQTCPVVPGMDVWFAEGFESSTFRRCIVGEIGPHGNVRLWIAEGVRCLGLNPSRECYNSLTAAKFAKQAEKGTG